MPIYIYNSLSRLKEQFQPIHPPEVKMYTCGVTVYDDCHIGHARSLYIFDVIRRYLEYSGLKVDFVRNITDIDDKIINRARELKLNWEGLVNKYIDSYKKDLELLSIRPGLIDEAGEEPRATNNIPDMIKYIAELIEKGYAYVTNSGVYFSVRKFEDYGRLSGQGIDQMLSGVRKQPDEAKQDPLDFALWKLSKPDEPSWDSPWGKGRPGWHIECSVMSQKFLKTDTLDIHGGGRDLIFPHHENEIAQSQAATGKLFAKYWIHHGLLTINGQKMAKSLGNFVTIKDVLRRYPADVLKIFYLQAHYSSPIDFSWDKMDEAKRAYERIGILRNKLKENYGQTGADKTRQGGRELIEPFKDRFIKCMNDNFDTPAALAVLFDMVNRCNKLLEGEEEFKDFILNYALTLMQEMTAVFGLSFIRHKPAGISDEEIEKRIQLRLELKKKKDFQGADKIRKELLASGIILEDAKDGRTTWRRKL
jgi:cysteinyl-tRNA synthetase